MQLLVQGPALHSRLLSSDPLFARMGAPLSGAGTPPPPPRTQLHVRRRLRGGKTGQRFWDDALAHAFSVAGDFATAGAAWVSLAARTGWGGGIWGGRAR